MTWERAESLKTFDGNDLFFRCFTPKNRGKMDGLILAVHGFGEHSGRYVEVAKHVCNMNMAFACFDLRGHGLSGPARGDAENLHAMVQDVIFIINHARSLLGITPHHETFYGVLGHSFGGLLATFAASVLGESCPPLFLSSPCYRVKQVIPRWKKVAAHLFPKVTPTLRIPIDIDSDAISENPKNNAEYLKDELNLFFITARLGEIFLNAVDEGKIRNAIASMRVPTKIVCGAHDKLTDVEQVKNLFPLFPKGQASLSFIDRAGHEIFNERENEKTIAFEHLRQWINARGMIR